MTLKGSIFIVVWSGGLEAPSYSQRPTREEAFDLAAEWWSDADEDSDWIDVLEVKDDGTIERLELSDAKQEH